MLRYMTGRASTGMGSELQQQMIKATQVKYPVVSIGCQLLISVYTLIVSLMQLLEGLSALGGA